MRRWKPSLLRVEMHQNSTSALLSERQQIGQMQGSFLFLLEVFLDARRRCQPYKEPKIFYHTNTAQPAIINALKIKQTNKRIFQIDQLEQVEREIAIIYPIALCLTNFVVQQYYYYITLFLGGPAPFPFLAVGPLPTSIELFKYTARLTRLLYMYFKHFNYKACRQWSRI